MKERWWTAPTEGDGGKTVLVTGRDYMDDIRNSGKYKYRITVGWDYDPLPSGMPDDDVARLMEQVTDAMMATFKKDKVAYMTGIYTGEGRRDWVFYTMSLPIFGKVLNRALEPLDTVPIVVEADEDPDWEEYEMMKEISYIPENEDE